MEIPERQAFNSRLVNWCLLRSWTPTTDTSEGLDQLRTCLSKVLTAEQVFRADLLQGRPGMPEIERFEG